MRSHVHAGVGVGDGGGESRGIDTYLDFRGLSPWVDHQGCRDVWASSLRKKEASRWCDWKAMWIKYPAPPKGHVPSDSLKTARFQLPIFPPPSKAALPAGDPSVNPWALWEKSHCWLWLIGSLCSLSIICWMSCSFLKYFLEGLSSFFNKELPAPVCLQNPPY